MVLNATRFIYILIVFIVDNELLPQNPEKLQEEQAKAEQKRLRSLKSQHDSTQRQSSMFSQRRPLLSSDYLDDNDDYDTTNISDFRRQKIAGAKKSYTRYTDDDEGIRQLVRYNY